MRSIWTGSIAFGLVNIPVKLYSAINERALDFDMLDKKDHSPIKFKRVNEKTGKEVVWQNIVKGYDLDGKYVVLTDEDFKAASPEKTKTINMEAFVNTAEVDVILFDHAYYLSPGKGGERAFSLLEAALRKANKAGVGTFVLRNKEKPVLLRSAEGLLILHTLRFINEIRDPSDYVIKKVAPKQNELTMAGNLIKGMSGSFNIGDYKDEYTSRLKKLIRTKASGKKLPVAKVQEREPSTDLIEQLQQSLARPGTKTKIPTKSASKTKTASRAKTATKSKSPTKSKTASRSKAKK